MAAKFLKALPTNTTFNYTATGNQKLVVAWGSIQGGSITINGPGGAAILGRSSTSVPASGEFSIYMTTGDTVGVVTDNSGAAVSVVDLA